MNPIKKIALWIVREEVEAAKAAAWEYAASKEALSKRLAERPRKMAELADSATPDPAPQAQEPDDRPARRSGPSGIQPGSWGHYDKQSGSWNKGAPPREDRDRYSW